MEANKTQSTLYRNFNHYTFIVIIILMFHDIIQIMNIMIKKNKFPKQFNYYYHDYRLQFDFITCVDLD